MAKIKQKEEVFIAETDEFGAKQSYEEWICEIKAKQPSKLKLVRPNVKITEDQAAILNEGVINGSNSIGTMYFKK
jgi:hypothetical protein